MPDWITFTVRLEEAGWAYLEIVVADRTISIACSHLVDTLGELVRTFARLARNHGSADITCLEEPGDVRLRLRRWADRFQLAATRFSWEGDAAPETRVDRAMTRGTSRDWNRMRRSRNKKAMLRHEGAWNQAVASFIDAFEMAIERIGEKEYVRRWGHPFPRQPWTKLLRARTNPAPRASP